MEARCPFCHSPIYSRKNKFCGVCEKPLPKELLMSDTETAFWKKEMEKAEKNAKESTQQLNDLGSHHGNGSFGL